MAEELGEKAPKPEAVSLDLGSAGSLAQVGEGVVGYKIRGTTVWVA